MFHRTAYRVAKCKFKLSDTLLSSIPHCVIRKFGYLQNLGYFPLKLCPKLREFRHAKSIALSTTRRRRRRRSSLLTTPIRQSRSRGSLLQVGQL